FWRARDERAATVYFIKFDNKEIIIRRPINVPRSSSSEMIARGKYVPSQVGPLGENSAFLVASMWLVALLLPWPASTSQRSSCAITVPATVLSPALRLSAATRLSCTPKYRASSAPAASIRAP
ncbi:unnamed protein product, partial [Polarella glacialis]